MENLILLQKQKEAISQLQQAFRAVDAAFDDSRSMDMFSDKYPFDSCFSELTSAVDTWSENMIKNISKYTDADQYIKDCHELLAIMDDSMLLMDEEPDSFYKTNIYIGFGKMMVTIPVNAAAYQAVQDAVKAIIEDY